MQIFIYLIYFQIHSSPLHAPECFIIFAAATILLDALAAISHFINSILETQTPIYATLYFESFN